jgi:hypothetical protein
MGKIENCLKNIADKMVDSPDIPYFPGLFYGKMGIAVFLCHYSAHAQDERYGDFAYGLITKAQNQLHGNSPVNYAYGLSGIGTAIEYLVQNHYIEADTDEVLEDFDHCLSNHLISYSSLSSINQILDMEKYFSFRIKNTNKENEIKENIKRVMNLKEMQFSRKPVYSRKVLDISTDKLTLFIEKPEEDIPFCLINGLAGIGLTLLSDMDKRHNTWLDLIDNKQ